MSQPHNDNESLNLDDFLAEAENLAEAESDDDSVQPDLVANEDVDSDEEELEPEPGPEERPVLEPEQGPEEEPVLEPEEESEEEPELEPEQGPEERPDPETEEQSNTESELDSEPEDSDDDVESVTPGRVKFSTIEYDEPDLTRPFRRHTDPMRAYIDKSRRQSRSFATSSSKPAKVIKAKTVKAKSSPGNSKPIINIGAEPLEVRAKPKPLSAVYAVKLYNKHEREKLFQNAENKQNFLKAAGGHILTKHNKLAYINISSNVEGALKSVHNLQSQLKTFRQHCNQYDIGETLTIVVPDDVERTPDISEQTFDLLVDYPKLQADIVANSCAYYNIWAAAKYVGQNMGLIFKLMQNNTEEHLWNKCLEEYEEYELVQQGGPLMFFLILRKIQNVSEDAIQHLRSQLEKLKISKSAGENVENTVSLVKSTHRILKSASTLYHNYVPDDFPKTILQIFQTTSIPEFNEAFAEEERSAQRKADKSGGMPVWPDISEITSLATNTYQRLKNTGHWVKPKPASSFKLALKEKQEKDRLYLQFKEDNGKTKYHKKKVRLPPKCWNCGGKHSLHECTEPQDEARIKKNKREFYEMLNEKRDKQAVQRANKAAKRQRLNNDKEESKEDNVKEFGVDTLRKAIHNL